MEDKEGYESKIKEKAEGQSVNVFITKQWTLEYELAANGFGEDMLKTIAKVRSRKLKSDESNLRNSYLSKYSLYSNNEEKASYIYSFLAKKLFLKQNLHNILQFTQKKNINRRNQMKQNIYFLNIW